MTFIGLMLWCEPCGLGWSASEGRKCYECGEPGSGASLVYKCTRDTGLAVEGAQYARAHPTWRR